MEASVEGSNFKNKGRTVEMLKGPSKIQMIHNLTTFQFSNEPFNLRAFATLANSIDPWSYLGVEAFLLAGG